MIYKSILNENISFLGLGAMRLPTDEDGTINEEKTREMVKYAIESGINYFDTAWPYHAGKSEIVIGKLLNEYPRESWYLANKYPGHQISKSYDPADIFEQQLEKCGVEYFDFYLLHNVCERSMDVYLDKKWGIIDYFKEQKRLGRIKHLGFSTHGTTKTIKGFLDLYGKDMEFCQIQLNYLDWSLQNAKSKYELLTQWNIPIIVMEPVRGGRLASLNDGAKAKLKKIDNGQSDVSWCFRFLQSLPNIMTVLSGMSNMEQLIDNVNTCKESVPVTDAERAVLFDVAEELKVGVPCTACRYCCDGCPQNLDIPVLLSMYNELCYAQSVNIGMQIEALPAEKRALSCISCGKCTRSCPQNIDIPAAMKDFEERFSKMPKWADICRKREEEALKNKRK